MYMAVYVFYNVHHIGSNPPSYVEYCGSGKGGEGEGCPVD
jgi:hypothetical protein